MKKSNFFIRYMATCGANIRFCLRHNLCYLETIEDENGQVYFSINFNK